jgi:transformation/transcription domain-associated protein
MLAIFTTALKQSPRIYLLFDITSIYTFNLGIDVIGTTKFLYEHVAMSEDEIFRQNILMHFLTWFADSSHTWAQKAYFVRYIITPILLVHATRSKQATNLINSDFIHEVH